MLSIDPIHKPGELRLDYQQLPVDVIAEAAPSVSLNVPLADLRKLLLKATFLVIVDRKGFVLGAIGLNELARLEAGSKDWLSQTYRQDPGWFETPLIASNETVQQANVLFEESRAILLPIVNPKGKYTGKCVSLPMLERLKAETLRPPRVGGLATPLGVYMTSGYYSSGAGWPGLLATGFLFGVLARLLDILSLGLFSVLIMLYPPVQLLPVGEQTILEGGLLLTLMFGLLRLTPLSGLHAAEHMTINAIERDLDLTEPLVRTQSREHQRCGTNLVVFLGGLQIAAISLAFAYSRLSWIGLFLYVSFWFWLVLSFWQPVGLWLQRHFTTKNPTRAQLASGIRAGKELLEKFTAHPHGTPPVWRRLWGAGLFHMMAAFMAAFWLMGRGLAWLGWS